MKTTTINQKTQCESQLNYGSLLLRSLRVWVYSLHYPILRLQTVRAICREVLATLAVVIEDVKSNNRLQAALFFILAAAPFSWSFYSFFDKTVVDRSWFFQNYFNLFLGLQGNMAVFFVLIGSFLLSPAKCKQAFWLAAPIGFILADSVKKILATTNDEYNQVVGFPYVFLTICFTLGLLLSMDRFLYKHHHIKRKYWAHIVGIIRMQGVPADHKMKLLEGEIKSVEENYYSIY